jgi:hypothetical protein
MKRALRDSGILLAAGLLILAVAAVWAWWVGSGGRYILAHGTPTTATVTRVEPAGCKPSRVYTPVETSQCLPGTAHVSYTVAGVSYRAEIAIPDGYRIGDTAVVFYDPRRPEHAVLPGNPVPEGAWWGPINLVRLVGFLALVGALAPWLGEGVELVGRRWAARRSKPE